MSVASQDVQYACGIGANWWIERWFGDCVYTPWDTIAFFIGLSSVCFWLIAQLPQFISNIVRSAADALSPWFLVQWLTGDTFNLLGCILTGDQLKTQIITAAYFIFSDIIIITQYVYYQVRNRKDFDESIHKGSGYCRVLAHSDNRDSALGKKINWGLHANISKDNFFDGSTDGINEQFISNKCMQRNVSEQSKNSSAESLDCVQFNQTFLSQALSDFREQDGWMYDHRHRLRRVMQEYNLDYGHSMAKQIASLYNNRRKNKHKNGLPRKALENSISSKRPQYKAVLGIMGFFGIVSVPKFHTLASQGDFNNSRVGIPLGRRALLALYGVAHLTRESSTLVESDQPSSLYIASHRLHLSQQTYPWTMVIGRVLGWGSSALYLGSRLSQLHKNRQRRSADGLSLGMVACAVLANITYGASIIMRGPTWDNLIGKAPWLVGSFGTVFLDLSIVTQAYYYGSKKGELNEYTPLLA